MINLATTIILSVLLVIFFGLTIAYFCVSYNNKTCKKPPHPHPNSEHFDEPINVENEPLENKLVLKSKEKFKVNFKTKITDAEHNQRNYFPKFTSTGYKLTKLPDNLYSKLQDFWKTRKHTKKAENTQWVISKTKDDKGKANLFLTNINVEPKLVKEVNDTVEKMLIDWVNENGGNTWTRHYKIDDFGNTEKQTNTNTKIVDNLETFPLKHTATYGIRTYGPGNQLAVHLDRGKTHILSAIIFIDKTEKYDNDGKIINWPISAQGFKDDELKHINMDKINNILLYESATVFHGRVVDNPLDEYSNFYVHFAPETFSK